jgi:hypothetical protein
MCRHAPRAVAYEGADAHRVALRYHVGEVGPHVAAQTIQLVAALAILLLPNTDACPHLIVRPFGARALPVAVNHHRVCGEERKKEGEGGTHQERSKAPSRNGSCMA